MGDPRQWHLVIDDCGHSQPPRAEDMAEGTAVVSWKYVEEMKRARGIAVGAGLPGSETMIPYHLDACRGSPRGACDLEFTQTTATAASHLLDFVDAFEGAFPREYLDFLSYDPALQVLFRDHYGDPLVVIRDYHIQWLQTIDVPDAATRLKAYEHLCYRTVPKLWPEVYSDLFRPSKVEALEREREQIITELRRRVAVIDTAIDDELRFYAGYAPLTELSDDPLKLLVKRAFEQVFGCVVTDLDEEIAEGESKTLDLLIERSGWRAFVEVRASLNRGARREDIEKMEEHYDAVVAKYGKPDAKVFIFNGMYRREPERRTDKALFSGDVVGEARSSGVTLLSTTTLLQVIESRRNGEITDEEVTRALSIPGLFESLDKVTD